MNFSSKRVAAFALSLALIFLLGCGQQSSPSHSSLEITTTSLPSGAVGKAYSQSLAATGGTTPYTWTITTGTLPSPLTLNASTGLISGTPTGPSTTQVTYGVTDSSTPTAQTATVSLTLTIAPAMLQITTTSLPSGTAGMAYSQSLAATGGTTPYTWKITTGTLPSPLTLNASTGLISGTPTGPSTTQVTYGVTDSSTPAQTATVSLTLTIAPAPLQITTTSLPIGMAGIAYSQTLSAVGGVAPYTWNSTGGQLPTGLTLDPTTGTIAGTPTVTGIFSFTIGMRDSSGSSVSAGFSLNILPAPLTFGFDFRSTSGYVTDPSYAAPVTGETFPHTYTNGAGATISAGFVGGAVSCLNGSTSVDPRLAGACYNSNGNAASPSYTTFQVTLPSAGSWTISLGAGAQFPEDQFIILSDGGTPFATLSGVSTPADSFIDATGTVYTAANWVTGNTPITHTFTSTTLSVQVGPSAAGAFGYSTLAHLKISQSPAALNFGFDFRSTSGYVTDPSYASPVTGETFPHAYTNEAGATISAGFVGGNVSCLNGSTSVDARLAGACYNSNGNAASPSYTTFQVTLPSSGSWTFSLAAGGPFSEEQFIILSDGGTPFATLSNVVTAADSFMDATGTVYAAANWVTGSTPIMHNFRTTSFTVQVGATTAGAGAYAYSTLAYLQGTYLGLEITNLGITTAIVPRGIVGSSYTSSVGAIGGTSPYSWSITGTLPAGLSLNGSTGGISGTPTSAGTSSFSIQVHDSGGFSVSASYSLTITNNLDLVVADGDSITFGQGATTPYTGLLSLNGGPWSIINDGISGELLATMVANAPTKIDPLYANREGANIVVIWGGTNDFDQSATAADVYYDYVTYCLARHAAGWKVIVATKLSAQGQEADKDALNPLILANSSGCFDAIADFTGTPLGVDGGYANTTWFQSDGVHPTQAGITTYEAPIISAAINSLVP